MVDALSMSFELQNSTCAIQRAKFGQKLKFQNLEIFRKIEMFSY
jgi:hypothetical protein